MANGYCINWKKLEVNQDGEGTPVHPLVALAFSAAVGGLFVVFLPFIGLYLFGKFIASKLVGLVHSLFETSVTPISEPGTAYMTGSRAKESPAAEDTLADLAKEIESKREV